MKGLNIFVFDLIESYFCFKISKVISHLVLYSPPAKDMVGTGFILEQSLLIFICKLRKLYIFAQTPGGWSTEKTHPCTGYLFHYTRN